MAYRASQNEKKQEKTKNGLAYRHAYTRRTMVENGIEVDATRLTSVQPYVLLDMCGRLGAYVLCVVMRWWI